MATEADGSAQLSVGKECPQLMRSDVFIPRLRSNDPELRALCLSNKVLTDPTVQLIADALARNTRLRSLDLSGNHITSASVTHLCQALAKNSTLSTLNLANNAAIGEDAGLCLVETLSSHNNHLTTVDLTGTGVSEATREKASYLGMLNKHPNQLKSLAYRASANDSELFAFELTYDLSDIKAYVDETITLIVRALENNATVRSLKLDRCCRGDACCTLLAELLRTNNHITRVSLASNHIGHHGVQALCKALASNPNTSLEELNLTDNEVGDIGAAALIEALETNNTLYQVHIGQNDVSAAMAAKLRSAASLNVEPPSLKSSMPLLIASAPQLSVLDLRGTDNCPRGPSRGYFTNLGALTVADILRVNTVIHTLDLSNNHIGPEGARALGEVLRTNTILTSLDLSGNHDVGNEGARHLLLGLQHNDSIVSLNLTDCTVDDVKRTPIQELCQLNAQPLPLKGMLTGSVRVPDHLDLSTIGTTEETTPVGKLAHMTAHSMPIVVRILQNNSNILSLSVANHPIEDEGVKYIAEALAKLKNLTKVNFSYCGLTNVSVDLLLKALRHNYTVRDVYMVGNRDVTVQKLQQLDDSVYLSQFAPMVKDVVPLLRSNTEGVSVLNFNRPLKDRTPPLGDDTCRVLFSALRGNSRVTSIDFSNQGVSNRGLSYICDALSVHNCAVHTLLLPRNDIGVDGGIRVGELLQLSVSLTHLDLSHNNIREAGARAILAALSKDNRTLQFAALANNNVPATTAGEIESLVSYNSQPTTFRARVLEAADTLTHVTYHGSETTGYLDDRSFSALYNAFSVVEASGKPVLCTSIDLCGNMITDGSVETIAKIMQRFPQIKELSLDDNRLTNAGVEQLVLAVMRHGTIVKADVSRNVNITPALQTKLSLAAQLNKHSAAFRNLYKLVVTKDSAVQQGIELTQAQMDDDAVELLCAVVEKTRPQLQKLVLTGNRITNVGAIRIAELVTKFLPKLHTLCLDKNAIALDGGMALRDLVWDRANILSMPLDGNPIVIVAVESKDVACQNVLKSIQTKLASNAEEAARHEVRNTIAETARKTDLLSVDNGTVAPAGAVTLDQTLEDHKKQQDMVMEDALALMPKRQKFVREVIYL